jgi:hypothetical protein
LQNDCISTLIPWNSEDRKPTGAETCEAGILNKPDGIVLLFTPLTVVFEDIKYSIDMPKVYDKKFLFFSSRLF